MCKSRYQRLADNKEGAVDPLVSQLLLYVEVIVNEPAAIDFLRTFASKPVPSRIKTRPYVQEATRFVKHNPGPPLLSFNLFALQIFVDTAFQAVCFLKESEYLEIRFYFTTYRCTALPGRLQPTIR